MDARGGILGFAVLASVSVTALPALADRAGPPGPVPDYYELPSIWQGLYAGGHVGFGWAGDLDGVIGGGQIGYNWQSNRIVYGVEADISLSDIHGGDSVTFMGASASASARIDWLATVRGRIGYLIDPRLLAYATAGVGFAHSSWDASAGGFGFGVHASGSDNSSGFVIGAGVESKISETMSARLEYLTGFDNAINNDNVGILRAGLNIKLGR